MRGAKSDFEIFADTEETSKSSKRSERSRKDASRSISPPTDTRPAGKGTARPKRTAPADTVPKPALKVLGNNNKENIDPRLGKPAGKKKSGNSASQDASKSPSNKILAALNNNTNRNILQGKPQQQMRKNDKPTQSKTPISKQIPKASTLPFSPLADITEAYNSKCPTPLPLSVSFSGTSAVTVDQRSEQASAIQLSSTAVRILRTEPRAGSSAEDKTVEFDILNVLHEDISPETFLKTEKHNRNQRNIAPRELQADHPEDHGDDTHVAHDVIEHAKEPVVAKDTWEKKSVIKTIVDASSSPATMKATRSSSGNLFVDDHQPPVARNETVEINQTTPIQIARIKEEKNTNPKERTSKIKTSVNRLKRKAPDDGGVVDDERPHKRLHDENYTACTDLLVIKLGSDRSETTTTTPAKKPFFKRFIMECAPGF